MIGYIFFRLFVLFIGLIPFPILYRLSNGLAWILGSVVKYRRNVISANLNYAFPDLDDAEKQRIIKASYVNLCDIILESFKSYTTSNAIIESRYKVTNPDFLKEYFQTGKSITAFASHYTNWEWGTITLPLALDHTVIGLIKPLGNKYIHDYIINARGKNGTLMISIYEKDKSLIQQEDMTKLVVYIADQNPSNRNKAIPIKFFGRDTMALQGGEIYARSMHTPVILLNINRVKRGYYEVKPELLSDDPNAEEYGALTQQYFNRLEAQIIEQPEYWLWSHKRWKHEGIY